MPSPPPTAAARCGTAPSGSPRWSALRAIWKRGTAPHSLLVQGTAAMIRAEAAQRAGGRHARRRSGGPSCGLREPLGRGLAETTGRVTAAAAGSLLPVLAAREVAVASEAERMFPQTTVSRVRGGSVADEAGWLDGTAAADAAHMDGRTNTSRLPRGLHH